MKNLKAKEVAKISAKIDCFFEELHQKYDTDKYSELEYKDLLVRFQSIEDIDDSAIKHALKWKYGKKTITSLMNNKGHARTARRLSLITPALPETCAQGSKDTFEWLFESNYKRAFISVAFITHLIHPASVPIVDQHTFRAVRYFLHDSNERHRITDNPRTFGEIESLRTFVELFAREQGVSTRTFDKYLMMFGKHVAPRG